MSKNIDDLLGKLEKLDPEMFGNAGKLPCDFDDYFEARDAAQSKFTINVSTSPDIDIEKLCEKIKAEILAGLS